MGRPRPALAAPAEDAELVGRDAVKGGDLMGRVDRGNAAAEDGQAIGDLRLHPDIDPPEIANGSDVARLGDDRKAQALVEQRVDVDEWCRGPVARLRAFGHLLDRGADM